jgi:hypothetical protein
MIRKIWVMTFFLFLGGAILAQQPVTEKDLLGTWQMVIEDLEHQKERFEDKDSRDYDDRDATDRFGRAIESAVNAFVSDLIGDIDIQFTFMENHRARLTLDIMGEHETESLEWYINDDGYLVLIDDDRDDYDDDVWAFEDGKLVSYEMRRGELIREKDVHMVRIND